MIFTIAIVSILSVGLLTFIIEHQLKKRHSQPEKQDHLKKLELINYVRECRGKGFSDDNIKKKLLDESYDTKFIDDCLNTNYKNIK